MYWYKLKPVYTICICILFMAACKPEITGGGPKYFSLNNYFKAEADRLNKLHPTITKSVNYNNQPETKTVTIKNWKQELGLFIESDINKPAWRGSYKVITKGDSIIYNAIDTNLRTRQIAVVMKAHNVHSVQIINFTKNLLYQTGDRLSYYPDSVYRIEKHQTVKILGANNYELTGKFQ